MLIGKILMLFVGLLPASAFALIVFLVSVAMGNDAMFSNLVAVFAGCVVYAVALCVLSACALSSRISAHERGEK